MVEAHIKMPKAKRKRDHDDGERGHEESPTTPTSSGPGGLRRATTRGRGGPTPRGRGDAASLGRGGGQAVPRGSDAILGGAAAALQFPEAMAHQLHTELSDSHRGTTPPARPPGAGLGRACVV